MIDVDTSGHYIGDCRLLLGQMPESCVQTVVTSPPYWGLRDYGHIGQIGLESTPDKYVSSIVEVFSLVRRVLRDDGTLWINLGDSYYGTGSGPQGETGETGETGEMRGRSVATNRIGQNRDISARARGPKVRTNGLKNKDLVGIPWMVAFALRSEGWYLRSEIIWHKPNPMPESVGDRPTKSHEHIFLLSKSNSYYYDAESTRTPLSEKTLTTFGTGRRSKGSDPLGRVASDNWTRDVPVRRPKLGPDGRPTGANIRTVWTVATQPYSGAHFAVFPPRLIEPCILSGAPIGGLVLDPFFGSGTTGMVARRHGRRYVGFDLGYKELSDLRVGALDKEHVSK